MARRNRTAEILAAANLVPLEIAREQEQTRRQSATSQALASLVPALIQGGAGIAGDVIASQKADARQAKSDERDERDYLADMANRKATVDAQMARADAAKAKAEADKAKAATDAAEAARKAEEAARPQKLAGAAADVESEISMPGGVSQAQLEQIAVARGLPATEWRTVLNERDANVDKISKEALEIRKDTADAVAAERKPTGPKPPSQDQILRRENLELSNRKLRNELEGGPGSSTDKAAKASTDKKKQQVLEVDNYVGNIKRNIGLVKEQIAKTGTFELTGPEGAINERRLTEIATDMAKLADPGSVAREGEVALMRKGLVDTGIMGAFTRNETAQAVLDELFRDVDRRRREAYAVRGLEVEGAPVDDIEAEAADLGITLE